MGSIHFLKVRPNVLVKTEGLIALPFADHFSFYYVSSHSLYAKYYFALRSLVEKVDFRQRYNRMVGGVDSVAQSEALKIQKRTEQIKEEALMQISRSM